MVRYCMVGLLAFALASPLLAQGKGKGKGKGHDKVSSTGSGGVAVDVVFSTSDTRVIVDYYRGGGGGGLPPGLAKRSDLPPGLEKQLRRKGTLPPGLQKKIQPFPQPLVGRLPPLPSGCGCRRVVYDKWAMLIHDATNTIFDIIDLSR